jgi:hypothetical protein
MNRRYKNYWTILGMFFILILSVENAYAYLDLGTGTYLFQMIVAGFLSMIFAIKMYWNNLINFFKRLFKH